MKFKKGYEYVMFIFIFIGVIVYFGMGVWIANTPASDLSPYVTQLRSLFPLLIIALGLISQVDHF